MEDPAESPSTIMPLTGANKPLQDYGTAGLEERNKKIEASKALADAKRNRALRALRAAMVFCFFFMCCEIVGGYLAHSLAILTDAAHLLTDVAGFALSIFSLQIAARAASGRFSFGWHRAEVVGTLASLFTIWALVSVIFYEALTRVYTMYQCSQIDRPDKKVEHLGFFHNLKLTSALPSEVLKDGTRCTAVEAPLMVVIGVLGLTVNMICAVILTYGGHHGHSHHGSSHGHSHGDHGHSHDHGDEHEDEEEMHDRADGHGHDHGHDHGHEHSHGEHEPLTGDKKKPKRERGAALNSAFLHALGDCVQSAGVILSALFIWFMNYRTYGSPSHATSEFNLADPVSSIFFGVITLYWTRPLMAELLGILMESTPANIDADAVLTKLSEIPGVMGVHDLHIWSLSAEKPSLSVHLVAENHIEALEKAQVICESFGITHHTIQVDDVQFGSDRCCSDIGCAPPLVSPTSLSPTTM